MTAPSATQVDLADPRSVHEPTQYFARARAAAGPVQWSDAHKAWMVISHAECEAAFREADTLSADRVAPLQRVAAHRPESFQKVVELLSGWMVFRDPPAHTRLRAPVKGAFTPRAVAALEPEIQQIVDESLAALPAGEPVDLRAEFAGRIPALVIAAVLGVDPSQRHQFQGWSRDLAHIVFSTSPNSIPEGPVERASLGFTAFFGELIERERANPSGSILSAIATMETSDLDRMELVGACTLLLFGGHETTTTLLNTSMGLLLERPELMEWMRNHPEHDATAVDEILRTQGPARSMVRKAAVDHQRGGAHLRAGDTVFVCQGAANHDPEVFESPETLDLARDPNPHLGFGWGLHFCIGASLARLEARIALRTMLERFPRIEAHGPVPPLKGSTLGMGREAVVARLYR